MVPMPGLEVAPKPVVPVVPLPKMLPPVPLPKVDVPLPKPVDAGLFPPKSDPPPKGELVLAVELPKPPLPNPVPPAVEVVEPNRPVPLLVVAGVPKAGLLPKPPEPKPPALLEPNPPPPPPKMLVPDVPVFDPKPVDPVVPKPARVSRCVGIRVMRAAGEDG